MNYGGTLLVVKDLDRSKRFYREVLGQEVIVDFGANVTLTGGFSLQTLDTWTGFIGKREREILFGANAGELYFEEEDFDGFLQRLQGMDGVDYVHPVVEHGWGQRGIRISISLKSGRICARWSGGFPGRGLRRRKSLSAWMCRWNMLFPSWHRSERRERGWRFFRRLSGRVGRKHLECR